MHSVERNVDSKHSNRLFAAIELLLMFTFDYTFAIDYIFRYHTKIHSTYCCFFLLVSVNFHRSVPLKSQLSTYTEKGKIPVLDFLSAALESAEYERALARGLVSIWRLQ